MTNAKPSLNCINRSFSEWFYKLLQTQQLPSTTPHQSTSSLTGVIQNISIIFLGIEEIPRLSAWDTSHITRAHADTTLPASSRRHWASPRPDCQSKNGERSSKNRAEERETEPTETPDLYLLIPSACGKTTLHFLLFRQDAKVQGKHWKWMLSAESQVNVKRWSKTCLPTEDSPSLMDISHIALAYTTPLFSIGSNMCYMPFHSKPPHGSPSDYSSWELLHRQSG